MAPHQNVAKTVPVKFEIIYSQSKIQPPFTLAVVGSIELLGKWDTGACIKAKESEEGCDKWEINMELQKNNMFQWRWIVISAEDEVISRECTTRTATIGHHGCSFFVPKWEAFEEITVFFPLKESEEIGNVLEPKSTRPQEEIAWSRPIEDKPNISGEIIGSIHANHHRKGPPPKVALKPKKSSSRLTASDKQSQSLYDLNNPPSESSKPSRRQGKERATHSTTELLTHDKGISNTDIALSHESAIKHEPKEIIAEDAPLKSSGDETMLCNKNVYDTNKEHHKNSKSHLCQDKLHKDKKNSTSSTKSKVDKKTKIKKPTFDVEQYSTKNIDVEDSVSVDEKNRNFKTEINDIPLSCENLKDSAESVDSHSKDSIGDASNVIENKENGGRDTGEAVALSPEDKKPVSLTTIPIIVINEGIHDEIHTPVEHVDNSDLQIVQLDETAVKLVDINNKDVTNTLCSQESDTIFLINSLTESNVDEKHINVEQNIQKTKDQPKNCDGQCDEPESKMFVTSLLKTDGKQTKDQTNTETVESNIDICNKTDTTFLDKGLLSVSTNKGEFTDIPSDKNKQQLNIDHSDDIVTSKTDITHIYTTCLTGNDKTNDCNISESLYKNNVQNISTECVTKNQEVTKESNVVVNDDIQTESKSGNPANVYKQVNHLQNEGDGKYTTKVDVLSTSDKIYNKKPEYTLKKAHRTFKSPSLLRNKHEQQKETIVSSTEGVSNTVRVRDEIDAVDNSFKEKLSIFSSDTRDTVKIGKLDTHTNKSHKKPAILNGTQDRQKIEFKCKSEKLSVTKENNAFSAAKFNKSAVVAETNSSSDPADISFQEKLSIFSINSNESLEGHSESNTNNDKGLESLPVIDSEQQKISTYQKKSNYIGSKTTINETKFNADKSNIKTPDNKRNEMKEPCNKMENLSNEEKISMVSAKSSKADTNRQNTSAKSLSLCKNKITNYINTLENAKTDTNPAIIIDDTQLHEIKDVSNVKSPTMYLLSNSHVVLNVAEQSDNEPKNIQYKSSLLEPKSETNTDVKATCCNDTVSTNKLDIPSATKNIQSSIDDYSTKISKRVDNTNTKLGADMYDSDTKGKKHKSVTKIAEKTLIDDKIGTFSEDNYKSNVIGIVKQINKVAKFHETKCSENTNSKTKTSSNNDENRIVPPIFQDATNSKKGLTVHSYDKLTEGKHTYILDEPITDATLTDKSCKAVYYINNPNLQFNNSERIDYKGSTRICNSYYAENCPDTYGNKKTDIVNKHSENAMSFKNEKTHEAYATGIYGDRKPHVTPAQGSRDDKELPQMYMRQNDKYADDMIAKAEQALNRANSIIYEAEASREARKNKALTLKSGPLFSIRNKNNKLNESCVSDNDVSEVELSKTHDTNLTERDTEKLPTNVNEIVVDVTESVMSNVNAGYYTDNDFVVHSKEDRDTARETIKNAIDEYEINKMRPKSSTSLRSKSSIDEKDNKSYEKYNNSTLESKRSVGDNISDMKDEAISKQPETLLENNSSNHYSEDANEQNKDESSVQNVNQLINQYTKKETDRNKIIYRGSVKECLASRIISNTNDVSPNEPVTDIEKLHENDMTHSENEIKIQSPNAPKQNLSPVEIDEIKRVSLIKKSPIIQHSDIFKQTDENTEILENNEKHIHFPEYNIRADTDTVKQTKDTSPVPHHKKSHRYLKWCIPHHKHEEAYAKPSDVSSETKDTHVSGFGDKCELKDDSNVYADNDNRNEQNPFEAVNCRDACLINAKTIPRTRSSSIGRIRQRYNHVFKAESPDNEPNDDVNVESTQGKHHMTTRYTPNVYMHTKPLSRVEKKALDRIRPFKQYLGVTCYLSNEMKDECNTKRVQNTMDNHMEIDKKSYNACNVQSNSGSNIKFSDNNKFGITTKKDPILTETSESTPNTAKKRESSDVGYAFNKTLKLDEKLFSRCKPPDIKLKKDIFLSELKQNNMFLEHKLTSKENELIPKEEIQNKSNETVEPTEKAKEFVFKSSYKDNFPRSSFANKIKNKYSSIVSDPNKTILYNAILQNEKEALKDDLNTDNFQSVPDGLSKKLINDDIVQPSLFEHVDSGVNYDIKDSQGADVYNKIDNSAKVINETKENVSKYSKPWEDGTVYEAALTENIRSVDTIFKCVFNKDTGRKSYPSCDISHARNINQSLARLPIVEYEDNAKSSSRYAISRQLSLDDEKGVLKEKSNITPPKQKFYNECVATSGKKVCIKEDTNCVPNQYSSHSTFVLPTFNSFNTFDNRCDDNFAAKGDKLVFISPTPYENNEYYNRLGEGYSDKDKTCINTKNYNPESESLNNEKKHLRWKINDETMVGRTYTKERVKSSDRSIKKHKKVKLKNSKHIKDTVDEEIITGIKHEHKHAKQPSKQRKVLNKDESIESGSDIESQDPKAKKKTSSKSEKHHKKRHHSSTGEREVNTRETRRIDQSNQYYGLHKYQEDKTNCLVEANNDREFLSMENDQLTIDASVYENSLNRNGDRDRAYYQKQVVDLDMAAAVDDSVDAKKDKKRHVHKKKEKVKEIQPYSTALCTVDVVGDTTETYDGGLDADTLREKELYEGVCAALEKADPIPERHISLQKDPSNDQIFPKNGLFSFLGVHINPYRFF